MLNEYVYETFNDLQTAALVCKECNEAFETVADVTPITFSVVRIKYGKVYDVVGITEQNFLTRELFHAHVKKIKIAARYLNDKDCIEEALYQIGKTLRAGQCNVECNVSTEIIHLLKADSKMYKDMVFEKLCREISNFIAQDEKYFLEIESKEYGKIRHRLSCCVLTPAEAKRIVKVINDAYIEIENLKEKLSDIETG